MATTCEITKKKTLSFHLLKVSSWWVFYSFVLVSDICKTYMIDSTVWHTCSTLILFFVSFSAQLNRLKWRCTFRRCWIATAWLLETTDGLSLMTISCISMWILWSLIFRRRHRLVIEAFQMVFYSFSFFFCFKSGVKHWSLYAQPLDLKSCDVSIHVFTLNEEGPSTLSLEEDEDLSAANHWLLPTGGEMLLSIL